MKSAPLTALLSLVPGVGHLYAGQTKKALALLCIDAGILIALFFFRSRTTVLLSAFLYLVTMLPAAAESYMLIKKGTGSSLSPKGYVVFMLLATGFSALPLLWQDPRFSKKQKIAWTIAVPALAIGFFAALFFWEPFLEDFLAFNTP